MDQSYKELIADALKARLALVTSFGVDTPYALINTDQIRVTLSDLSDHEIPFVQIIDASKTLQPERHRSDSTWQVIIQIAIREKLGFAAGQKVLWAYEQATMQAIMNKPDLGLIGASALPHNAAIKHALPSDVATDLHTFPGVYVASLGFLVLYYEPMTRRTC